MKIKLILGDQLNIKHSWFNQVDDEVIYVMMEMRQETDYAPHHIQKVIAFFGAMRNFNIELKSKGHRVEYLTLDDQNNKQNLEENLNKIFKQHAADSFAYLEPDEYRLDKQLKNFCKTLSIPFEIDHAEHFMTSRTELTKFFEGKKQLILEFFYRYMRKKFNLLMHLDQPEGGQWNFDKNNRKKWKGSPKIPPPFIPDANNLLALKKIIEEQGVKTIGSFDQECFLYPLSRKQALKQLDYFCEYLLVHFGDYQDALHTDEVNLFHSRISFALNTKMIDPLEVVQTVIEFYIENKENIELSQVEGFVRQIIGWREYMRGIYWKEMPGYRRSNKLDNQNKLPDFYWNAETKMNCLNHSIKQSLEEAYAHHIQRLMITGNFALLAQVHPDEVDAWYLGIYIDAIEWVEMPNTRGMSQFADGGIVATKPYVSSGSYINKMSNYCKDCHYNVNKKQGEDACPFNSLYWNFLDEKREHFQDNQRMNMMMSLLNKMNSETLKKHKERAADILKNPNKY